MKNKLLLILTLTFSSFLGYSQLKMAANDKADLHVIQKKLRISKGKPTQELLDRFAINKMSGGHYLSVICKVSTSFSKSKLDDLGIIYGSRIGDIVTLKLPLQMDVNVLQSIGVEYVELASKVKPNLDKAVKDVRADSVQYGWGLPQSFTGRNVLIGITDWGFDYTHPMFYDTSLTQTRIEAAWDQYKLSGPNPTNFSYGTEYNTIPDLLAAGSDTANIYSYALHGSHVAGICGGGGAGIAYRGVAFDAKYLFTTFLVDNASVLDAYAWMYEKAQAQQKRLVINMSWGLYHMGTLDGNSILSQAIDNYSHLGVVFCNSGGNNGGVNFHIKKDFANDTIKSKIDFYSSSTLATLWGQSISMWGQEGNSFSAKLSVLNSSNTVLNQTNFYSTITTTSYIDTFMVIGSDTVFYNISADNAHPANNRPQMRLRVRTTNSTFKIILNATAPSGIVHFWNVTELTNDVGNWGMPFTAVNSSFVGGNDSYGISEPACTKSLISVAAYSSEYKLSNGNLTGGAIASFSSKGPTLDDRMKPDIAAPGVNVASSISSFTDNSFTQLTSVNFNSKSYPFARLSGTSMASPMVTGIVALMLEANPLLSAQQVKDIIIETARQDAKTGVIADTGSVIWGHGKIHAWRAVKMALETQSIAEISHNDLFFVYPNPAEKTITVSYASDYNVDRVEIISATGQLMNANVSKNAIDIQDLTKGFYFVKVYIDGKSYTEKFVKE